MEEASPVTPFALSDTYGRSGRLLLAVARLLAIAGGLILLGLVAMLVTTIVGRKLFGFVVPGDMEVLQMLAACAAAWFFPYCHLLHGDIRVDFFTHRLPLPAIRLLDGIASLCVALVGAVLAWRSWAGAMAVREAGETSMILGWPAWLPQALMVPGFVLLAVAGGYLCAHQLRLAWRGGA